MKRVLIVSAVLWILISGAAYAIAYSAMGVERLDILSHHGVSIYGTVAAKQPEKHQSVIYYYVVDEIQYTGRGGAGRGNPGFDNISVGDRVAIVYDEDDPFSSYLGNPNVDLPQLRTMAIIVSFFASTAIVGQGLAVWFIVAKIRKSRSLSNNSI
jgi:hypothetical protein